LAFAALSGDVRSIKLLLEYIPKVFFWESMKDCVFVGVGCEAFAVESGLHGFEPITPSIDTS